MHPKRHPIRMEYWAGCDAEGNLTAVEARMIGDSGPYASVGMKVLERAAGHASGPYHGSGDRRRSGRRPHEQPGVRRVPRVRGQPGAVRHGGRARPPGREGRHLRVGDAQAQRRSTPARCGDRARSWTTAASAPGAAWRRCGPTSRRRAPRARPVGLGLGLKNSGLGNGFKEIAKAVVRFLPRRAPPPDVATAATDGRGAPLLDRDGPGDPHGRAAGRGGGAGGAGRSHPGRGRHDPRAGRRPDHREPGHADGRGFGGRRVPEGHGRRLPGRCGLRGRVPGRLDELAHRGRRQPDHPFGVRLRRAGGDPRPRDGRDREGRRRPRRRAGRQPDALRGPDRGRRPHGSRVCADRGLPGRRGRPADQHDAPEPRTSSGPRTCHRSR